MTEELNNQELQFLIDISEEKMKECRYEGFNISTQNASIHKVDVYFLTQKLQKLQNEAVS